VDDPRHPPGLPRAVTFTERPCGPLEVLLSAPPGTAPARGRPALLYLHGGAWIHRDPHSVFYWGDPTLWGYVCASATYRLSAEARWPAQREDIHAAFDWLVERAGELGVDPRRIGVWGHSAGGHLAAWLALTRPVAAAVTISAPTDFLSMGGWHDAPDSPESRLVGAPVQSAPGLTRAADPARAIHPASPPMLLIHGADDATVPPNQSAHLAAALGAAGRPVEYALWDGVGHMFLGRSAAAGDAARAFFDRHLRPG